MKPINKKMKGTKYREKYSVITLLISIVYVGFLRFLVTMAAFCHERKTVKNKMVPLVYILDEISER